MNSSWVLHLVSLKYYIIYKNVEKTSPLFTVSFTSIYRYVYVPAYISVYNWKLLVPTYILTLFFFDMKIHLFFRPVFSNPKSIQASVTLLERLAIILDKSTEADMRNLVLPLLFNSLESKMSQIQVRDDMMNSNNLFLIHVLKIWKSALQSHI